MHNRLHPPIPSWLPPEAHWQTSDRPGIGHTRIHFPSIASTNDFAKIAPFTPDHSGIVILADHQTAGRGQYGRHWASRPGASVLMSVVLYPPNPIARPVLLTAWVAVAVSQAVQQLTGRRPRIKWPNDLLVEGKKLCGILIEMVNVGGALRVVAGIGLNVEQTKEDFAQAGLPDATSLALIADPQSPQTRDAAVDAIIHALHHHEESWNQGDLEVLETEWCERSGLLRQEVEILLTNGLTLTGILCEMTFQHITLETATDSRTITPEVIRSITIV